MHFYDKRFANDKKYCKWAKEMETYLFDRVVGVGVCLGGLDKLREDGKIVGECIVCGALTLKKCSKCKVVFFCDKDHQKMDWLNNEAHRKKCGRKKKRL